jgi:hypothetical protein
MDLIEQINEKIPWISILENQIGILENQIKSKEVQIINKERQLKKQEEEKVEINYRMV